MPPSADSAEFREALRAAVAQADTALRLDMLATLAHAHTGFVETLQLDKALGNTAGAAERYAHARLAVLSSHTIDHLLPAIRVAGLRHKLRLEVHGGAFGQYRQELLDPASPLQAFRPEFVLLSLSARQAIAGVPLSATDQEARAALASAVDELRTLWERARNAFDAVVIQQTFMDVSEPLFGAHDRLIPAAPSRLVGRLNDLLAQAAVEDGVLLLDIAGASARDGLDAWFDVARWLQAKMEIAPPAAGAFGELAARIIGAQRGKSRKCLVLDLDDTLWGGMVGDAGTAGIVLGEGSARGEAHLALQRYAKLLKDRGVILAVCSKNESALAEAAFRDHPEMALRRDDVAAFVANWNDKAQNLREIAERLNIGLDSLVFVDDNPAERARVRQALPMVAVPELPPDPALYVRCIARGGYFEALGLTQEDLQRGEHYATNARREALLETSKSVDDFLRGLGMSLSCGPITAVELARATQLINKTNQFNPTTRRYSADEVARLAADSDNLAFQVRLADRFGDNGLVSVIILRPSAERAATLAIDTWVMSCRVFGRQLEDEVMNIVVEAARARGVQALRADYVPSERNGVVSTLYERLGFAPLPPLADDDPGSRWLLDVAGYQTRPTAITRGAS